LPVPVQQPVPMEAAASQPAGEPAPPHGLTLRSQAVDSAAPRPPVLVVPSPAMVVRPELWLPPTVALAAAAAVVAVALVAVGVMARLAVPCWCNLLRSVRGEIRQSRLDASTAPTGGHRSYTSAKPRVPWSLSE
jgi:hypothetical protein